MRRAVLRFTTETDGSSAIEYSLIVAGLSLGVLAGVLALGEDLQNIYASIQAGIAALSLL